MKIKNQQKSGFSLAEALIALLLIAALALFTAPMFIKKTEKKTKIDHGVWECKLSGINHVETTWKTDGTLLQGPTNVGNSCTFKTPRDTKAVNVDICGGNPLTACRNDNGTHVFMTFDNLKEVKNVVIGEETVNFGKYLYAYKIDANARILVVY